MRLRRIAASLVALCAMSSAGVAQTPAADSTWRDHDRAARAARGRGDWADARYHLQRLDTLLRGHPRVTMALARALAHLGDSAGALAALTRVADMGLQYDVASDTSLAWLRDAESAAALRARLGTNGAPAGAFTISATLPQPDFVAEGIAYDVRRSRFLVSSVRYGTVVAVSRAGTVRPFADLLRDGGTTPLGLVVDPARDRLWVAMDHFPTTARAPKSDSGRAGVMAYDLASGRVLQRLELPRGAHQTGDLCLAPNGDVYLSDGRGAVYTVRRGSGSLALLVPAGVLVSAQGCAVDRDGRHLFVADYALGIASVDVTTGNVAWVPHPSTAALIGTDGLTLAGDRLIGVQNGVDPNRVLEMQLDRSHTTIIAAHVLAQDTARIIEPTHVVLAGGDLYFIANGGFGMYDDAGVLRSGVHQLAPRIGRIAAPSVPRLAHPDTAAAKAAVLAADRLLAADVRARGDVAFTDVFDADGVMLVPGGPIVLASAWRAGATGAGGDASPAMKAIAAIASDDGQFACTYGFVSYQSATSDSVPGGVYASALSCRAPSISPSGAGATMAAGSSSSTSARRADLSSRALFAVIPSAARDLEFQPCSWRLSRSSRCRFTSRHSAARML